MTNGLVGYVIDKNKFIFSVEQETEASYRGMLLFIIERLKEGFTTQHVIEFNSKNKNTSKI